MVCVLVRWGYFVYVLVGQVDCVVAAWCSSGLFNFVENFKTGVVESCIVNGQCVYVVVMFQSWGAVAQLFQNLWC